MRADATYSATELEEIEAPQKATVIVLSSAELVRATARTSASVTTIETSAARGRHPGGARVRRRAAPPLRAAARRSCSAARSSARRVSTPASFQTFSPETKEIREGDWRVAPVPHDLQDRRVEITGPVDRKMVINALNSGARCFMADFEDANSPTWRNCIEGQANLTDAIERTIELDTGEKTYRLNDEIATLIVRPRGWHLDERNVPGGDDVRVALRLRALPLPQRASACSSAAPARTSTCRSSRATSRRASGTTSSTSPRTTLGLDRGTIKATVLIETILAAFEMEEILFELRDHIVGLNAGRWDYIFSIIKKFRDAARVRAPRPGAGDDDRPVHAGVHRAAREDLPPARRPRDGRDGRVRSQPARRRGERARLREGGGRQGARGRRRIRRHVGRASRSCTGCAARVRPRPRWQSEPGRNACARRSTLRWSTSST